MTGARSHSGGQSLVASVFTTQPAPLRCPMSVLLQLWNWGEFSVTCFLSRRTPEGWGTVVLSPCDSQSSLPRVWGDVRRETKDPEE